MNREVLPTFFIIGAAKSGTTTLFDSLRQHPQIYLPINKETRFFSHEERYEKGIGWYLETYFKDAQNYPARGDASTHYLYWSEKVAPRIHQVYPEGNVKFIAIFRDPIQRAYSYYWHMVREGWEILTFEEALLSETERLKAHWNRVHRNGVQHYGYFRGGCYASNLKPFFTYFSENNFLFLLFDDLKQDFNTTIQRVIDFLEIDTSVEVKPSVSNPAAMPRSMRLHKYLREPSGLKNVIKIFFPSIIRFKLKKVIRRLNLKRITYPPLDDELILNLKSRYKHDIKQLETIIDRDLSAWYTS